MLTSLFADERGEIFDAPGWGALGQSGKEIVVCNKADMIPLPPGSELMYLPGRTAMGIKRQSPAPMGRSRQAVAGKMVSGVTVATMIWSMSPGSRPASATAALAASKARSLVA